MEKEEVQVEEFDEGNMEEIWDITIEDMKRLKGLLTPTVEALPKPKRVMQSYMPSISFPNKLKFVRQEEPSEKVMRTMEVKSLRIAEEILHANVESITKLNGIISNPSSILSINDIVSVPIHVSEVMQPLTSQAIHVTPPDNDYVAPPTIHIFDPSKEFDDELLSASLNGKKAKCNDVRELE
uniref:ABC transporter C family member 14 n=1 Tax=Tanacetum cinerariifolium TaxID=118510 RepID=A0A6L2P6L0_TANCI|nr:ABC transporter C family member 14 [Tanacetum cinerariifolium]